MGFWILGRDTVTGSPDRMLSDAETIDAAREQAQNQGLTCDQIEPAEAYPGPPGTNAEQCPSPERTRPRVRLWLVSLVLFVGGFACRMVLERQNVGEIFWHSIPIESFAYGTGLVLLFWEWLRSADTGPKGILGCLGLCFLSLVSLGIIASATHR